MDQPREAHLDTAGKWALRRDPTLQMVVTPLRQRRRDPGGQIDAAQVQQLSAAVRARLAEARDSADSA